MRPGVERLPIAAEVVEQSACPPEAGWALDPLPSVKRWAADMLSNGRRVTARPSFHAGTCS